MEEKKRRAEEWSAEEAVEQAAQGNTEAFGALYEQYNAFVKTTAFAVSRNHQDAEDVAHTVWTKLLKSIVQYSPNAAFKTWLYRVAQNAAIDHARKKAREVEFPDSAQSNNEPAIAAGLTSQFFPLDQESIYIRERIVSEVERAAKGLDQNNEVRGTCFRMYYIHEMTIRDISDALRLSEGTVKSHLFYCRRYVSERHPVLGELHLALEERLGKSNGNRMY
jgi:RNA polymerase sigma factor (sigma-70 family)